MLTLILAGTKENIKNALLSSLGKIEAVEIRLDLCIDLTAQDLSDLLSKRAFKVILTMRMKHQGGSFEGNFDQRFKYLKAFLSSEPDYIDLEYDTPVLHIKYLKTSLPLVKILSSYHDFTSTPEDLESIYTMVKHPLADVAKIALWADSSIDALKFFNFARRCQQLKRPLIAISMGPFGQFVRILTKLHSEYFCYCTHKKRSNPLGILSLDELENVYNYFRIHSLTKVYALIGSPTTQSPSHVTHNYAFKKLKLDAIYVKIEVRKEEVENFFSLMDFNVFKGFSITTPLKEIITTLKIKHSFHVKSIESANTWIYEEDGALLENTDYIGAMNAIEEAAELSCTSALIIGTGGAAKALAYGLSNRALSLGVMGRDLQKLAFFEKKFLADVHEYKICDAIFNRYKLIINTTTIGMQAGEQIVDEKSSFSRKILFDIITYPRETPFLDYGKKNQCTLIYGERMFLYQASWQFHHWFKIKAEDVFSILEKGYSIFLANCKE